MRAFFDEKRKPHSSMEADIVADPEFYFSDEQRALQRNLREFVIQGNRDPSLRECDATRALSGWSSSRSSAELGYLGSRASPKRVGGSGRHASSDYYTIAVRGVGAYGSAGIALGIYVHMALACAATRQPSAVMPSSEYLADARRSAARRSVRGPSRKPGPDPMRAPSRRALSRTVTTSSSMDRSSSLRTARSPTS